MSAEGRLTAVKIKEEEIPADINLADGMNLRSSRDKGTSGRYEQNYRAEEVHHPVKEENLNIVVVDIGPENARANEMGMRMDDAMEMHPELRNPYTKPRKGYMRKPYKKWWSPVKNHGVVHKMKYARKRLPSEYIMNPEFLKEFIHMYHSFPCLWNVKFADYSNKQKRMKAYEQLVQLCRTVCPTANVQFVKHKIANLRTVFKKEFNKVQVSKRTAATPADVYVPRLWYFDLLKFTLSHDMPEDGSLSMSDAPIMVSVPNTPSMLKMPDTPEPQEFQGDEEVKMNSEILEESTNMSQVTSNSQSEDVELEIHDEIMASIRRQRKRKMYSNTSEEELGERLLTQAAALLTKNNDEYDAFGFMVSSKLRRMDEQQRLLAEVLIMEVLYKGMLGQLTEDSLVCQYPGQFYQNQPSS